MELVSSSGRTALKQALLEFFVFADALEAHAMREAVEACITVLDAPGPLDKKKLAPWLKLTHERAADLFRRGMAETTGALRVKMADGLRRAEQDARWMQEVMDELEGDEPS